MATNIAAEIHDYGPIRGGLPKLYLRAFPAVGAVGVLAGLIGAFAIARIHAAEASPKPPKIFVAADSTAVSNAEFVGWGDALKKLVDPAKASVINCSKGGTSCRNYVHRGEWDDLVISKLHAGDYVLIQFGQSEKNPVDAMRNPGALPGTGDEHVDGTDADGESERVGTYGSYVRKMISDVKARHATPVLLCSGPANAWSAGVFHGSDIEPNRWTRAIAADQKVRVVDLYAALCTEYQRIGAEKVRNFFPRDHIHLNARGADFVASVIVASFKDDQAFALNTCWSDAASGIQALSARPPVKVRTPVKKDDAKSAAVMPD